MTIGSELAKYIGNEMIKAGGKELAKAGTTSALSNIIPGMAGKIGSELATKSGMSVANSALSNLIPTKATKSPDIDKYLGGRLLDDSGKPMTFYHSTPNDFSKFDDSMLGKNTGYSNTSLGHFVTNDKDFSKRFIDIDNVGKTGRTMELQAKISNPITHPYMAGKKYGDIELDNIVKGYLEATDNQDLLDELMSYADENGSSLYDEYMDMTFGGDDPFEFSGDERELLKNKGYDAVEIVEGTKNELVDGSKSNDIVSSYAVLDGNNLRPVRHIPVNQARSSGIKIGINKTNMDDDLSMLMSNDESNLINKMNGNDTTADELVVKNILNKHGISDKTFSLLKGYSDLGNSSSYEKYKSALSKLLESGNEEVKKLNKISRDIIMSMGIEFEDNMPVVYRAVPHNSTGDGMSYTLDKKIAEKLVKNDGDTYKSVIRYVIKPDDIVIAPQILGPIDNGGDLRHIIVKKIKNS